jgi:circadian clock protein KaiC
MAEMLRPHQSFDRSAVHTGVPGLDDVLHGGFTPNRLYVVEGVPGSGKTTLAMQFLIDGARAGEPVLYVTLSETEEELHQAAASHGWSLDGVRIHEIGAGDESLLTEDQYTMFHPSEMELAQITRVILSEVERIAPTRVVFDSLSELRLLAGTALRYRRQILALKRYFSGRQSTVLLLDDLTAVDRDLQVQSIAHGVLLLDQMQPEYGGERRRLKVVKHRGCAFRGGFHDYVIRKGGLETFPRLTVEGLPAPTQLGRRLPSGIVEVDGLIGGGIETGTSTLIVGAPGTGKSTLGTLFVHSAAARGERAAMFIFDESHATLLSRSVGLGLDLGPHIRDGRVTIRAIDPAELSPGEFAMNVARMADEQATIIVIDSLNGYLNAMPGERSLVRQLHEMLSYLGHRGVATVLIAAQQGLIGAHMSSPIDATYLADAVILLRYFEAAGEVRQAMSVIKKRGGQHERTIREFRLDGGVRVGPPLREFRGVLTGVPVYRGDAGPLIKQEGE